MALDDHVGGNAIDGALERVPDRWSWDLHERAALSRDAEGERTPKTRHQDRPSPGKRTCLGKNRTGVELSCA
jgi:hypothetical protein